VPNVTYQGSGDLGAEKEEGNEGDQVRATQAESVLCKVGDYTDANAAGKVHDADSGDLNALPLGALDVVVNGVTFSEESLYDRTDVVDPCSKGSAARPVGGAEERTHEPGTTDCSLC